MLGCVLAGWVAGDSVRAGWFCGRGIIRMNWEACVGVVVYVRETMVPSMWDWCPYIIFFGSSRKFFGRDMAIVIPYNFYAKFYFPSCRAVPANNRVESFAPFYEKDI